MRNLSKRDPAQLAYARERKQAKVDLLNKAISGEGVSPELQRAWERLINLLQDDINQIDSHLGSAE